MRRPWHTWALFSLFLGVVLTALAWVTVIMLRLQAANIKVQQDAALEETVRLALWRMDAAISPLIIEESSRPHTDYNAVNPMARLFPNVDTKNSGDLVPSPLFVKPASNVVLYFNSRIISDKEKPPITSPQIPPEPLESWGESNFNISDDVLARNRSNLARFAANVDVTQLQRYIGLAADFPPPVPVYQGPNNQPLQAVPESGQPQTDAQQSAPQQSLDEQDGQLLDADQVQAIAMNMPAQSTEQQQIVMRQQEELNTREYQRRQGQTVETQKKLQWSKQVRHSIQNDPDNIWRPVKGNKGHAPQPVRHNDHLYAVIQESVMRPIWVHDMLVLSRNVTVDEGQYVQGAWLDWQSIKAGLLAEISDLLPAADLVPAPDPRADDRRRMLASLPVRLVPGPLAAPPAVAVPPLGTPLLVAWAGVIVSVSAVTALLFGAVSLSERRGAFVSAVTHELRTPLTTFRMYTEMLSEGLIKDKEKRKSYLVTLNRESNRLGHLVENVLAYARLERGAGARVLENLKSGQVIERARTSLSTRAQEAGMQLLIEYQAPDADAELHTDPTAVGQILMNLVDNACKYAAGSGDNRIHLSAHTENNTVSFTVRDHGPGLRRGEIGTVFKPFRKSARDAARSAPGVGLGLALCKRLARQLGGDLRYETHAEGGACFSLRLPAA